MIQFIQTMHLSNRFVAGVSMVEYAVLIGLVCLVSLLGLQSLGTSTKQLLSDSGQTLEIDNTLGLLQKQVNQKPANLTGSGYYVIVKDPVTQKPKFQVVEGNQATATNVTSIDGDRMNTLGTIMIANRLQEMAEAETDPELKNYYAKMAELSFYLGGAEGELDDIPELTLPPDQYTNADALKDILTLSSKMKNMLNNPPSGLSPDKFNEVMPLASNVYNIALNYKNKLGAYIDPNGYGIKQFDTINPNPGASSGTGEPGSVFTNPELVPGEIQNGYVSYSSVVPYKELKNSSEQVLGNKKVKSEPVKSTLNCANKIDRKASQYNSR